MSTDTIREFSGSGSLQTALTHYRTNTSGDVSIFACEISSSGARKFMCGPTTMMIRHVARVACKGLPACYFEVLSEGSYNMYADLECYGRVGDAVQDGAMLTNVINIATAFINHLRAFLGASSARAIISCASRATKHSFHITAVAENSSGVTIVMRNISDVQAHVHRAVSSVQMPDGFIDDAVYRDRQNFRILFNDKYGKRDSTLLPIAKVTGTLSSSGWTTAVDHIRDARSMLCEIQDVEHMIRGSMVRNTGHTVFADIGAEDLKMICVPDAGSAATVMEGIVVTPTEGSVIHTLESMVVRFYNAPRGKPSWSGFWPLNVRSVITLHDVMCALHGRVHKSNGIIVIVDMINGVDGMQVHQKCHNNTPTTIIPGAPSVRRIRARNLEMHLIPFMSAIISGIDEEYVLRAKNVFAR